MANRYLPEDPSSWGPSEKDIEAFPYRNGGRKPPALAEWQEFATPWQKRAEERGFADPFAMIGRDIAAAEHDQKMRETEARLQAEIEREIGLPAHAPRPGASGNGAPRSDAQRPPASDNPSARPDDAMTRQAARQDAPAGARIGFTRPPPQQTMIEAHMPSTVSARRSRGARTEIKNVEEEDSLLHLTGFNRPTSQGGSLSPLGHMPIQYEPDMTAVGDHLEVRPPPVTFEPDSTKSARHNLGETHAGNTTPGDAIALDRKYRKSSSRTQARLDPSCALAMASARARPAENRRNTTFDCGFCSG